MASHESVLERAERLKKWVSVRDREDLRYVLREERGRRCLESVLRKCGVFDDIAMTVGEGEVGVRVGMRRLGLHIMKRVKALDPALLAQMEADYADGPQSD